MAISFVAAGTVVTGTNPSVTVPAGYQQGDLLITVITGTATPTTPTPWKQIYAQGANQFVSIFYKTAGPSESNASFTVTGTTTKAVMLCYRGVSSLAGVSFVATNITCI